MLHSALADIVGAFGKRSDGRKRSIGGKRHVMRRRPAKVEQLEARCVMTAQALATGTHDSHEHLLSEPHSFPLAPADVLEATFSLPTGGPAPLADTFRLHSNPTAKHTIYLDFDGHVTVGTQWNTWKNMPSIYTGPWDPNRNGNGFGVEELYMIQGVWQRVAEDFAPFDVNVTTEDPGVAAIVRSGAGDTQWGVRVVITSTDWSSSGVGGHAWIGSFNAAVDEPVFNYQPSEQTAAQTASHEVGHAMYLSHDGLLVTIPGTPGVPESDAHGENDIVIAAAEYYLGHGAGETSWAPIMGNGHYSNVTTWDTGSYYGSNNSGPTANYGKGADDFAVITGYNGFGYLADDHGNLPSTASQLVLTGTSATDASRYDVGSYGNIGYGSELDFFQFTVGAGALNLTVDPYYSRFYMSNGDGTYDVGYQGYQPVPSGHDPLKSKGSNLDVLATLYDATGNVVATSNPASALRASFTNLQLAAGSYYLSVDGAGFGNWAVNPPTGYSDTVSLGQYFIYGSLAKPTGANENPVASADAVTAKTNTAVTFAVLGNDRDAEGDPLTVTEVSTPAHGTVAFAANGVMTYTPAANYVGADSFTYTILDRRGAAATGTVDVQTWGTLNLAKPHVTPGENVAVTFAGGPGNGADWIGVFVSGSVPGTGQPAAWYYTNNTRTAGGGSTSGVVTIDGGAGLWPLASGSYYVAFFGNDGITELAPRRNLVVGATPFAGNDAVKTTEDTSATIAVLANDSDPHGDPLTVTAATAPSHGTVFINADNTIRYTPAANYFGTDSFTYTIGNGSSTSAPATVTIEVKPLNDAPLLGADSLTTLEDTPGSVAVLANDSELDGGVLTITAKTNGAKGSVVLNADNTLTYTPNPNDYGSDWFTYTVSDGQGGSSIGMVHVSITHVQDPPVALDDSATTNDGTAVAIDVLANDSDADGNPLTVTILALPSHGSVSVASSGVVTYTPVIGYSGPDSFQYTAHDNAGNSDSASVSITVNWVDDPPIAGNDSVITLEDSPVTIDVMANDRDPEGGPIVLTAKTNGVKGTVAINADSTLTYTPNLNATGADSFTYTIRDAGGASRVGTVSVTITAVQEPPVAVDENISVNEDSEVMFYVLANDSDPDGNALSVTEWTNPSHGRIFNMQTDGRVYYAPNPSYDGLDSFTYTITDGFGNYVTATVRVTVVGSNDAPNANDDSATTVEDAPVTIAVLNNDSDPEGDTLTISEVTTASRGTVAINANGTLTYTPNLNVEGSDEFYYTISDGRGGSDQAKVSISIDKFNDLPIAVDDSIATEPNVAVSFNVLANDSDPEGTSLKLTAATSPAHGSISTNDNGDITFTPDAGYSGADSFTYTVTDSDGASSTGTVNIAVQALVNGVPVANNDSASTNEDTAVTINVRSNDTDPNGDALTVASVSTPNSGTAVIANNSIRYTPSANFFGVDAFTYTISDSHGATSSATVTVTVVSVNDRPVVVTDAVETNEDTALSVDVLANDYDIDGGVLTVTAKTNGTKGTVAIVVGGGVTYTPNTNATGSDSFTYTIGDGQGGTTTGTVLVTIAAINDTPIAVNDTAATSATTPVTIAVLANDTDVESNPLTATLVDGPTNGSAVLNANGTITYTANAGFTGIDAFTYRTSDGSLNSNTATVTINVHGPTKFFVVDSGTDRAYRYQDNGAFTTYTATSAANRGAVGMVSNSDGSRLWTLDSNRNVYVYDASMTLIGSWTANGLSTPKGISISGSDVWIVDSGSDRVYLYAGAASLLSGSQSATRNFLLPTNNRNPEDLATDGATIWVLQSGSPDRVFAYRNSDGAALGNWTIDVANTNPVGITLDSTGASQSLWIVDSSKDRVYEYASARSVLSGSQSAATSFALNSGNTTPQGIAWINAPAASPAAEPASDTLFRGSIDASTEGRLWDDDVDDEDYFDSLISIRTIESIQTVTSSNECPSLAIKNSSAIDAPSSIDAVFAEFDDFDDHPRRHLFDQWRFDAPGLTTTIRDAQRTSTPTGDGKRARD